MALNLNTIRSIHRRFIAAMARTDYEREAFIMPAGIDVEFQIEGDADAFKFYHLITSLYRAASPLKYINKDYQKSRVGVLCNFYFELLSEFAGEANDPNFYENSKLGLEQAGNILLRDSGRPTISQTAPAARQRREEQPALNTLRCKTTSIHPVTNLYDNTGTVHGQTRLYLGSDASLNEYYLSDERLLQSGKAVRPGDGQYEPARAIAAESQIPLHKFNNYLVSPTGFVLATNGPTLLLARLNEHGTAIEIRYCTFPHAIKDYQVSADGHNLAVLVNPMEGPGAPYGVKLYRFTLAPALFDYREGSIITTCTVSHLNGNREGVEGVEAGYTITDMSVTPGYKLCYPTVSILTQHNHSGWRTAWLSTMTKYRLHLAVGVGAPYRFQVDADLKKVRALTDSQFIAIGDTTYKQFTVKNTQPAQTNFERKRFIPYPHGWQDNNRPIDCICFDGRNVYYLQTDQHVSHHELEPATEATTPALPLATGLRTTRTGFAQLDI
jgi:hypothetical protein